MSNDPITPEKDPHNTISENPRKYNVKLAWLLASFYFAFCFIFSWVTGVLPTVLTTPLATPENLSNPVWYVFTAVCFFVIIVGYYVIWPKGTFDNGRKLYWSSAIIFGLFWGLSDGQFLASIWFLIDRFIASPVLVIVITFIVLATIRGLWQSLFWDIYISPPHNDPAWNGRKVLFVHIPNLTLTLTYLTLYRNIGIFILLQTLALLGSAYFMHFPTFWKTNEKSG